MEARRGSDAPSPLQRVLLPSSVDIVFLGLLFATVALLGTQLLSTDGDLGRHLRVGYTILAQHGLFFTDRFSFTRAGAHFVPYEWLSEVLFTLAHAAAGLPGVVALSALVIAVAYALLALFLRQRGLDGRLVLLTALGAAVTGMLHWLARPHLFTLLGTAVLLFGVEPRKRMRAWPFFPLFAVWANLHGGFLFGLFVLGAYLTGDALELLPHSEGGRRPGRMLYHLRALGFAAAGALVNPVGPAIYGHLLGYLTSGFSIGHTREYLSPDFHAAGARFFLLAVLAIIAVLTISGRRLAFPRLLVVLMTIAFALVAIRNVPLFALTALPLVALHAAESIPAGRLDRVARGFAQLEARTRPGMWSAVATLMAVAWALGGARLGLVPEGARAFDKRTLPVAAVSAARAAGVHGRIFNQLSWGGYMLFAWPEQKVFIDGQTDFYGEALFREYGQVIDLQPGWREVLERHRIDMALIGVTQPLAQMLLETPGWTLWYCDHTAALFLAAHSANGGTWPPRPLSGTECPLKQG